jgi:ribosomal protein S27AE
VTSDEPDLIVTRSGRILTESDIYDLVAEAERGYDLDRLRERDPLLRFICPDCGKSSSHPDDIANGYCGNCHAFTGDRNRGDAE